MGGTGYLCDWLYDPGNPNPDLMVGRAQSHGGWLQRVEGGGGGGGGWAGGPGTNLSLPVGGVKP